MAVERFADFVTVDLLDAVLSGEEAEPAVPPRALIFREWPRRSVLEGCPESVVLSGERHTYHEQSPPARALAAGKAVRHPVDEETLRWWAAGRPERIRSIRTHGVHSTMVVPVQARGTPLGVVIFARHRTPDPFDDGDQLLAEELAARPFHPGHRRNSRAAWTSCRPRPPGPRGPALRAAGNDLRQRGKRTWRTTALPQVDEFRRWCRGRTTTGPVRWPAGPMPSRRARG
ncbi:GAF domain-containing protein [Actinacidiphila oryziradicis]|uniref:GAF domain-containing protein n=1 Tax=Actinacidiphila oryziradicis TaxID=2571141 RepID=UPI00145E1FF2|nr:GAF domain-containing protein [Actinacidiphila oryziradicis]